MDPINWTPFISLAIQVPLVGAFMWFVLIMQERNAKAQAEREKEWREFLQQQRADHLVHEASMQEKWREFIKATNDQNNVVVSKLTHEIETMGTGLTASNALIMAHDTTTRELLAGMRERQSGPRRE